MPASPERRLRLAFGNLCTNQWIAGCHYLKNLLIALQRTTAQPKAVLYGAAADDSQKLLADFVEATLTSPLDRRRPLRWAYRLERLLGLPLGLSRLAAADLRRHGVDAIFASSDLGPGFNLPLLAWLPDFQHLHLLEMFSAAELKLRDNAYLRTAQRAGRIIISSQSVLADLQRFAPAEAGKGRVVNFVAHPPAGVYATAPGWVCARYHLPERFFYLPNQFWKHKNHAVVVEALGRLGSEAAGVTVVCSGNTSDRRQPHYFAQLEARVEQLQLRERFVILGMIPHDHVYQLIRQSQAVLQPSLFEGWSTSVEEAKSIGKRLVLADLPVHREQAPPAGVYFDPHDPQALAERLTEVSAEANPGPDVALEAAAQAELPRRSRAFGEVFMQAVQELVPG